MYLAQNLLLYFFRTRQEIFKTCAVAANRRLMNAKMDKGGDINVTKGPTSIKSSESHTSVYSDNSAKLITTEISTQTIANLARGLKFYYNRRCKHFYLHRNRHLGKPIPSTLGRVMQCTKKVKRKRTRIMDWKRYHRLKDIYDYIDELERDYPSICTVSIIGQSVEGRDIKMLKISNSVATNSPVWLDGSIHPREWISSAVVTYIADMIIKNFTKLASSMTNKDWHIVPVLNPDGYEYTHTCNRMWRKNRAKYGQTFGVDLNRNFSFGWGHNGEEGSSEEPDNVFYRGPAPFSEPETAAVRDTIMNSSTPFKVFLSFHSYFELIIFPWGYKKDPCPHYLSLLEAGTIMARSIYDSTGMIYKVGSTKDMTYFACGTSIDWSYAVANIPYSFMIELRSKKYKFRLPKNQITDTCIENWNALKSLMDYVDQNDIKINKEKKCG